ncbi:response regulator [Winogradskyella sediminis]|uniref:cAMP-binding domain of CRP or a regulatory subunit of cAMP-dependent protein kinases n=1 Tax=Winogradskyella sediminis TaxID=1382466 RepID=A0A1H1MM39_9FLAO|nr:response regulator [Winogradskyella sediminis]REG87515.1 CRP-like cAMP-binding protein [Winogradskyella sediminis]SDR87788.1 cAMP-binding domain of CRP or a regulatory subunit of cAMP-dependent protein kinases [Winogradskyella sediminis]
MKKVLLIEDDTVLRENTAELLELSNYEVLTAVNGEVGLSMAKQHMPDIIVCDIMMPVLDGYGVIEGLSKHSDTKFIPFIFLSAKTERQDVRKGMELGADDYITKPFTEDEIVNAIESRIAKVALLKEEQEAYQNEALTASNEDELRTLSDLKNFFDDNGKIFNLAKNEIIYKEGHNSNYIYLILRGVVKCYKFDDNGKELTTALHSEDDLFGYTSFTQNIPYRETAIAMKDVELAGVSKAELTDVLENNHKLTLEVIQLLTEDITGIKDQLLQMAYSSVQRKTAATILRFAKKLNVKPGDPIVISRSDLASVAGIATETLIRTMSDFKKKSLIKMEGRNVKILDLEGLQDIA